jgi:WhiB family transcriptional regulator, redox-sensing transcriptional regulator
VACSGKICDIAALVPSMEVSAVSREGNTMGKQNWTVLAACKGRTTELFVRGAAQNRAKQMCMGCPVRTECLAEALDERIEWGVWGGMTERERRAILKRRPNVTSWRVLLETARAEQLPEAASALDAGQRIA